MKKNYKPVSFIFINSAYFREDSVIVVDQHENSVQFGKVKNILFDENTGDVIFVFTELKTKQYSDHICAYEVCDTNVWSVIGYDNLLLAKRSLSSHMLNKQYVSCILN